MRVNAGFQQTWNAVIELFARSNIPVKVMDRSSGYIATERMRVGPEEAGWADCGKALGSPVPPELGQYTVLVHGDSVRSTVLVSASFTPPTRVERGPLLVERRNSYCASRGIFETLQEESVKADAEARVLGNPPPSAAVPQYATALRQTKVVKSPSETAEVFGIVSAGITLKIKEQRGVWLLLSDGNHEAWGKVDAFRLSAEPPRSQ